MKNKKIYFGGWSANNGSTYAYDYTDTNKHRLAKDMREMAKGNTFEGNSGHWSVKVDDEIEPVLSGKV